MSLLDVLAEAGRALRSNPLRALLTTLGMVFGVAAVIAMLAIAEGGQRESERIVAVLGAHNVIVNADTTPEDKVVMDRRKKSRGLSMRDVRALEDAVPGLVNTAAAVELKLERILPKIEPNEVRVLGVTANYPTMTRYATGAGRFFSEAENDSAARVAVLGVAAARKLFGKSEPIGELVKLSGTWFRVIGIMTERPDIGDAFEGMALADQNRDVYIPLKSALKRFRRPWWKDEVTELLLGMENPELVGPAAGMIEASLSRLHGGEPDFKVVAPVELLAESQRTQSIFALVMGCIAGISLLVGGIGIMNIMLATVLERVREIGIRRALGARRRDISLQFLAEAGALATTGGLLGVAVGYTASSVIETYTGWPLAVTTMSVVLSTSISMAVGLLFGLWPARRAAAMDPIEALRDPG